jgi:hypothetical protein
MFDRRRLVPARLSNDRCEPLPARPVRADSALIGRTANMAAAPELPDPAPQALLP